jgi:hypothetical protein
MQVPSWGAGNELTTLTQLGSFTRGEIGASVTVIDPW